MTRPLKVIISNNEMIKINYYVTGVVVAKGTRAGRSSVARIGGRMRNVGERFALRVVTYRGGVKERETQEFCVWREDVNGKMVRI